MMLLIWKKELLYDEELGKEISTVDLLRKS